jgi:ribose transport system substrate-binding protein
MKRIPIAAAAACLALLAAGCSSGGKDAAAGGSPHELALVLGSRADGFHQSMACGAKAEAEAQGVKLNIQGPGHYAAAEQTPILNAVAARKPDAILTDPTDKTAMVAPLQQATSAGIKLVLLDTTITKPELAVSRIATDNVASGGEAAKALAEQLNGKTGSVAIISTQPGTTTVDDRQKGFEAEIKNYPNLKYVGLQYAGEDAAKATQIFQAVLAANSDLVGVFATTDTVAEGAAAGIRNSRVQDKVTAIAFDASPAEVQLLKEGMLDGLVVQEAYEMGRLGVQQAIAALDGKPVTADIETKAVIATAKNLDDPAVKKYLYEGSCA